MYIAKILKRRDASSAVVAIVLALITNSLLSTEMLHPAGWLASIGRVRSIYPMLGAGWRNEYLFPAILTLLELVLLEVLIRVYVWLIAFSRKPVGKKSA